MMKWVGLILMLLHAYVVQVMEAQELYKAGKIPFMDGNALITSVQRFRGRCIVTFSTFAMLLAAVTFFILDTRWWTPLWVFAGMVAGRIIVLITSNPLLGETPRERWFNTRERGGVQDEVPYPLDFRRFFRKLFKKKVHAELYGRGLVQLVLSAGEAASLPADLDHIKERIYEERIYLAIFTIEFTVSSVLENEQKNAVLGPAKE